MSLTHSLMWLPLMTQNDDYPIAFSDGEYFAKKALKQNFSSEGFLYPYLLDGGKHLDFTLLPLFLYFLFLFIHYSLFGRTINLSRCLSKLVTSE